MKNGYCRICGLYGPLSFEHIPPKAAFNNSRVKVASFNEVIGKGPNEILQGKISQRGRGDYTLCERCNNRTGKWYAPDFIEWCFQAALLIKQTNGNPTLFHLHYLFPLRIIKQIVVMFFSVNHSGFRRTYPELEKFVLNKERRFFDPNIHIYAYYNIEGGSRTSGIVARGTFGYSSPILFSETNFPPLGFVMTYNSKPPDNRLVDISHFATYAYDEFKIMTIKLPVLPTHLWYPGDYRTQKEIEDNYQHNVAKTKKTNS